MSVQPQWEWVLLGSDGSRPERPVGPVFTSRFDAEQWIGEHWHALAGQGVARAQLLHTGDTVGVPIELPES